MPIAITAPSSRCTILLLTLPQLPAAATAPSCCPSCSCLLPLLTPPAAHCYCYSGNCALLLLPLLQLPAAAAAPSSCPLLVLPPAAAAGPVLPPLLLLLPPVLAQLLVLKTPVFTKRRRPLPSTPCPSSG